MQTQYLSIRAWYSIFWFTLFWSSAVFASQTLEPTIADDRGFRVVTVAGGLEYPWGHAFLPDGRILVTERSGRLRIVEKGVLNPEPIDGLPRVTVSGQGGLLDITLHPDYPKNGWIYFSYVGSGPGGKGTEVARARLTGNELSDLEILFRMEHKTHTSRHFGSRLVFDKQGYLYVSLGDRGDRSRAQRLDDHAGALIRLHDDGRIPEDNPFLFHKGAKPEIFSYGHRNIQGMALHPETGDVWTHEHGPQGGDEINIARPGVNYGWPVITYGANYGFGTSIGEGTQKTGMEQPLYYWVPSIAPSGMAFYTGDRFPQWRDSLFVGSLKFDLLVRLTLKGNIVMGEERLLADRLGRIRDVSAGPDGYIYLLIDSSDGSLVRLEP
ncbi:MAG: PQQ-dependent sugar dehydrogenase [Gammaproteobacteria bacterium]|nr:PQQ-dependent sugar dehydrogenase [Gammaproteobacteria bacterium]